MNSVELNNLKPRFCDEKRQIVVHTRYVPQFNIHDDPNFRFGPITITIDVDSEEVYERLCKAEFYNRFAETDRFLGVLIIEMSEKYSKDDMKAFLSGDLRYIQI